MAHVSFTGPWALSLLHHPLITHFQGVLDDRLVNTSLGSSCLPGQSLFRVGLDPIIDTLFNPLVHDCLMEIFLKIISVRVAWGIYIIRYLDDFEGVHSQCWPHRWPSYLPVGQHALCLRPFFFSQPLFSPLGELCCVPFQLWCVFSWIVQFFQGVD
jgi:hypothetical protein